MHWYVFITVASDALVLKHQAISIQSSDWKLIILDQFYTKTVHVWWTILEKNIIFETNDPAV